MEKINTWWTATILLLVGIASPIVMALRYSDSPTPKLFAKVQFGLLLLAIYAIIALIIIFIDLHRSRTGG